MPDETKEPLNAYTAPRDLRMLIEQTSHTLRTLAHELGSLTTPEHMVAWHRAPSHEARAQIVLDSLALWDKAHPGEYRGPSVTAGPQPQHTNTQPQPQPHETPANMNQPPSNFGPPQQQPQFAPPQPQYAPPQQTQQQAQFAPPPPQFAPQQPMQQFAPQQPQFAPPPPPPPPAQQFAPPQPPQQFAAPQLPQQQAQFAPPQPQYAPPPQQPQLAPPPQAPQQTQMNSFNPPQIIPGPVPGAPVPGQQPVFQPPPAPQPSGVDPAAQSFAQGIASPEAPKTRAKRTPSPAPAGDAGLGEMVLQNLNLLNASDQVTQDRLNKLEYLCVLALSGHVQQLSNLLQRTPQDVLAILMNDAGALKSFLTSMSTPKG